MNFALNIEHVALFDQISFFLVATKDKRQMIKQWSTINGQRSSILKGAF